MVIVLVMLSFLFPPSLSAFTSVQTGGANFRMLQLGKRRQSQGVTHCRIETALHANLFLALHYGGRYV